MRDPKFEQMKENCKTKKCGTRAKYRSGCKCVPCRAANSRYNSERERLRNEEGDTRDIVSAHAARQHILQLGKKGVGYKQVAAAAGVATSIVFAIRRGKRERIRQNTERSILAVDTSVRGDAALVPAGPTWKILNELLENGFTKTQLGAWLGSKAKIPTLQVRTDFVMAKTAMKVERLRNLLEAGKLRRERSALPHESVSELRQIRGDARSMSTQTHRGVYRTHLREGSPHYEQWRRVLGSDTDIPLVSPLEARADLGLEHTERNVGVYLVDLKRLSPEQFSRLVLEIASKFRVDPSVVEKDLREEVSFPIRSADIFVTLDARAFL